MAPVRLGRFAPSRGLGAARAPAGQNPYWRDGKGWYQLELRPMLPDEEGCATLVG